MFANTVNYLYVLTGYVTQVINTRTHAQMKLHFQAKGLQNKKFVVLF